MFIANTTHFLHAIPCLHPAQESWTNRRRNDVFWRKTYDKICFCCGRSVYISSDMQVRVVRFYQSSSLSCSSSSSSSSQAKVQQVADRSGHYRTSTASARSQWALPDLDSTASTRSQWALRGGWVSYNVGYRT